MDFFQLCFTAFLCPLAVAIIGGVILLLIERSGLFPRQNKGSEDTPSVIETAKVLITQPSKIAKNPSDYSSVAHTKARLAAAQNLGISEKRVIVTGWEVVQDLYTSDNSNLFFEMLGPLQELISPHKVLKVDFSILDKKLKNYTNHFSVNFDLKGKPIKFPAVYIAPSEIEHNE